MKKKVGILFTGQIRSNSLNPNYTYDNYILESICKYFLNCEFKQNYEYDVFISTDDIDVHKAQEFFGPNLKNINITEKNWYLTPIQQAPHSYEQCIMKYKCKNINGFQSHEQSLYQYYRLYVCYHMLKAYSNNTYDYIVRIRLDAIIIQNLIEIFNYLDATNKLIFIEHEQLMIVKPGLEQVFELIKYYGLYDELVDTKYAIYLYLTSGKPLAPDTEMRYCPEKQMVDHIYYTLLQQGKDYFNSLCGVQYPSYNVLYRGHGIYGYVSDVKPIHNIQYITRQMESDFQEYLVKYPMQYKVLFVNHKIKKCGVYQYGTRLYNILTKSKRVCWEFVEINSYDEYVKELQKEYYNLIFYNYHPDIMGWLNEFNIQKRVKNIGLQHDLEENNIFDITLRLDPTLKERPERYNIQRPLFDNAHELLNNYCPGEEFEYFLYYGINTNVPIIGSFGFGLKRKNFDKITKYVCDNYDEAIIKFVMPKADTQDFDVDVSILYSQINKPGIQLLICNDFVDELDILKFLQLNTLNIFMYESHPNAGVSSVIDYALSVNTPLAITNSSWVRHIYSEEIDIDKRSIYHIIKYSPIICDKYREEHSNDNLLRTVERHVVNTIRSSFLIRL